MEVGVAEAVGGSVSLVASESEMRDLTRTLSILIKRQRDISLDSDELTSIRPGKRLDLDVVFLEG